MKIKEKIIQNKDIILEKAKGDNPYVALIKFGKELGFDNRIAFSRYKKALKTELSLDLNGLRMGWAQQKKESVKSDTTITLYCDAASKEHTYAVTTQDGEPVWYGRFFDDNYLEQAHAELNATKKAVWLARQVANYNNLETINLELYCDAAWLMYADTYLQNPKKAKKAAALGQQAMKLKVNLNVHWIRGEENVADQYTRCGGYLKWQDGIDNIELIQK